MTSTLIAHCGTTKISRDELRTIPAPLATATFKPIPHHELVDALIETLSFRKIGVVKDEYAASADGMKLFGVLDLENGFEGCRFSIGLRNANDKSMRLGLTSGLRVFVCDNLSFQGEFTPVLAKHSKNFSIVDSLAIGVDRKVLRSEEHTSELQSRFDLVCRLLLEKKKASRGCVRGRGPSPEQQPSNATVRHRR